MIMIGFPNQALQRPIRSQVACTARAADNSARAAPPNDSYSAAKRERLAAQSDSCGSMPALQVVQHADLTAQHRSEIVALCSDAYEEDFAPYFRLLSSATHVLAIESSRIVSHAAWLPRQLRLGHTRLPLSCAYVEAVATPISLQRKGLGTLVLRAIPPLLDGYDVAALSPSEPAFYARAGWEMWAVSFYCRQGDRRFAFEGEEVMIHRLLRTPAALDLTADLECDWREGDVW